MEWAAVLNILSGIDEIAPMAILAILLIHWWARFDHSKEVDRLREYHKDIMDKAQQDRDSNTKELHEIIKYYKDMSEMKKKHEES